MALTNKSFETAGATPGSASTWTVVISVDSDIVATFALADDYTTSSEKFIPGWDNDVYLSALVGGTEATFDSALVPAAPQHESFDRWVNNAFKKYQATISGGVAAEFLGISGQFTTESFEVDWDNTPYATTISGGSTITETLNTGWGNTSYVTEISGGVDATFELGVTYEDFAPLMADIPFIVQSTSTSTLFQTAHGLTSNQAVTVLTTGIYPDGLAKNVVYYAIVDTADTFRLSMLSGPGAGTTITSFGTGDLTLRVDPTLYWTQVG